MADNLMIAPAVQAPEGYGEVLEPLQGADAIGDGGEGAHHTGMPCNNIVVLLE